MYSRIVLLSTLVPTLSYFNVWDLPLWLWQSYAAYADEYLERMREVNHER